MLINSLCYCDGMECSYCFDKRMAQQTMTKPEFTRREKQVLTLMSQGKHNSEIAVALAISEHTAKFHVNSVMLKTKQNTRLGAVICALKHGMISLDSLMPEIVMINPFMTATGLAIIEENKQAMEAQKQNWIENIVNDIIEELYDGTGRDRVKTHADITTILKDYFAIDNKPYTGTDDGHM